MYLKDLNLENRVEKDFSTLRNDKVTVYHYISIGKKADIIDFTLKHAKEDGCYNPIRLSAFFHLGVVLMYTDILLSPEDLINIDDTFDTLESSGLLKEILAEIPKDEYEELRMLMEEAVEKKEAYMRSVSYVLDSFVTKLPENVEKAAALLTEFDSEKYKEVVQFAQAANAGKPVPVN